MRRFGPAGLLLSTLWTSAAFAQVQVGEPRDFGAERFVLSMDKNGLLNVDWANVPPHLSFDLSLWMGVADDPLSLYRTNGDRRERVGSLVSTRVGGELSAALALFGRVQIALTVPLILYQTREPQVSGIAGDLQTLNRGGFGAPRIAPKIRIADQSSLGVHLAVMPVFVVPTSEQTNYFGQAGLVFEPTLLVSRTQGSVRLSGNLGARIRRAAQFVDLRVDDELFLSAAVGVGIERHVALPVELETSLAFALATSDPFSRTNQSYFEALIGAKYDLPGPLLAFAGGGLGLNEGHGAPDWRVLAGLRISDHEADEDHDGVLDEDDQCVDAPEDIDDFDDADGCPDLDDDDDGIMDTADGARLSPEDVDGFLDHDGIPDHDDDSDGVMDWDDRCGRVAGVLENFGCPDVDTDEDGVVDRLDECPGEIEDRDDFDDADGCLDADNDGDGIVDTEDRCPNVVGVAVASGCADADGDSDGVVDRLDNCPATPGVPERQGCERRQLVTIGEGKLEILKKVYFDTGSDRIQQRSYALLDNVSAVLLAHEELEKIVIEGHTDDRGKDTSNLSLSERRAAAVRTYLIASGVADDRLTSAGYGETKPVEDNRTAAGRAANRRVEFLIVDGGSTVAPAQ